MIYNYRSCKFLDIDLNLCDPNIFIGLNDSGKSALLQSIDLLLGNCKYNYNSDGSFKSDLSNSQEDIEVLNAALVDKGLPEFSSKNDSTIVIGKLVYTDYEADKYSELNLTNALQWTIESNKVNEIWIAKRFFMSDVETFIIVSESENPLGLWNASATVINSSIKELGISKEDISNENGKGRFTNLEKTRAIYNKLKCSLKWSEYKFGKSDKDIFPSFSLFDWNSSLEEIVATANAIMRDEINVHIDPIKRLATESARKAEDAINEKFGDLSSIIQEVAKEVEEISSKVHFEVKEKISDIMVTKKNSDGAIHLENQGEGLKRQIWFSLIKAKAKTVDIDENKFIWAFDEPETHLYPGAQRELFDVLLNISNGDVQTIVSTHSTIFIDKSKINKINSVTKNEFGYSEINYCKDIDSIFTSLSIKNSDFLFHNRFLIVEGDTEQYLIPSLYKIFTGKTLTEDNIQLINIQGKNKWNINKQIIDKILGDFKKSEDQVIFLFDNDMSFEIGASKLQENMFFVGKQDIEDSIEDRLWLELLNDYYNGSLTFQLEEIEAWKEQVISNSKCQEHEKFYKILNKGIKEKFVQNVPTVDYSDRLPTKGAESAELLLKFIKDEKDIPSKIKDAFIYLNL